MRGLRLLVRPALLGILYFLLLMSIVPAWFYPPVFRAGANLFLHDFGSGRVAKYEALEDPQGLWDTKISVGSDASGQPVYPSSLGINCVREGYTPTALFVALMLATPAPWRQKWRPLGVGLLLVQCFVGLRVAVAALYGFSRVGVGDHRLLEVGSFGSRILHRTDQILTGDLHFTYIAPLMIWLLVAAPLDGVRALWMRESSRVVVAPRSGDIPSTIRGGR